MGRAQHRFTLHPSATAHCDPNVSSPRHRRPPALLRRWCHDPSGGTVILSVSDRIPLAYFLTFRTYGSWLHGDARGSVTRFTNQYGTEFLPSDPDWERQDKRLMTRSPVTLDEEQRKEVDLAIRELCSLRGYLLRALNVRTNHVHTVVSANTYRPALLLNALKARATAALRRKRHWIDERSPWSDGGSKRYVWTDASLERTIDYVLNQQD